MVNNPFILYGYESEKYFCGRKEETRQLLQLLENGNNVSLIAPRRIGKTGLIENLFHLSQVKKDYYTFLIDIYATKNIEEMIAAMGSSMLSSLRQVATDNILRANEFNYQSMLFQLPPKQKELLIALSKAGKAEAITSTEFIRRWHLSSASSVQSAIKGLLDKNFVTMNLGVYEVYDRFLALWLARKMR